MSTASRQRQRKNGSEDKAVAAALTKRSTMGQIAALPGLGVPKRVTLDGTIYDNSRYGGFVNVTKLAKQQQQEKTK